MLLLLNERGDPSFLFQNLSSYNTKNQLAKFDKNPSVGSIDHFRYIKIQHGSEA